MHERQGKHNSMNDDWKGTSVSMMEENSIKSMFSSSLSSPMTGSLPLIRRLVRHMRLINGAR